MRPAVLAAALILAFGPRAAAGFVYEFTTDLQLPNGDEATLSATVKALSVSAGSLDSSTISSLRLQLTDLDNSTLSYTDTSTADLILPFAVDPVTGALHEPPRIFTITNNNIGIDTAAGSFGPSTGTTNIQQPP